MQTHKHKHPSLTVRLRVNKRHCNVAGAVCGGQSFMKMSQSTRMHKTPTFSWRLYRTVIPVKSATSTLKIDIQVNNWANNFHSTQHFVFSQLLMLVCHSVFYLGVSEYKLLNTYEHSTIHILILCVRLECIIYNTVYQVTD